MTDMSIADRMAAAAEINLGLPYSLVCDAWDLLDREDEPTLRQAFAHDPRTGFNPALMVALDHYEADPIGYQFNPRATD